MSPKNTGVWTQMASGYSLIRSSFFLYAKIAGAHKSSPAAGKEKGCGCEGDLTHKKPLTE